MLMLLFFAAASLFGQDAALGRLRHGMEIARVQAQRAEEDKNFGQNGAARIAAVHAALRDWLELRLPRDIYSLAGEISRLDASLQKALVDGAVSKSDSADQGTDLNDPGFDEVGIELRVMPEVPDTLFVTATVGVP